MRFAAELACGPWVDRGLAVSRGELLPFLVETREWTALQIALLLDKKWKARIFPFFLFPALSHQE